jgi:hypothetical protein
MSVDQQEYKYEFKLRLFNTEVFCVGFNSTSESNRWIGLSIGSVFLILLLLVLYGSKLLAVFA